METDTEIEVPFASHACWCQTLDMQACLQWERAFQPGLAILWILLPK